MIWAAWITAGSVAEAIAVRRHRGTLSEAIARTARVDTTAGKFAFSLGLGLGSLWLWIHIVRFRYTR